MAKKLLIAFMLVVVSAGSSIAASFTSEIIILEKPDIVKLSDEKLTDTYMNALVEIEAIRMFHATSGFSPSDYKDFKNLLKFRMLLLAEIHSRNLEMPQFDHL